MNTWQCPHFGVIIVRRKKFLPVHLGGQSFKSIAAICNVSWHEFQLMLKLGLWMLRYTLSQRTKPCAISCKGIVPWIPLCILSGAVGGHQYRSMVLIMFRYRNY